jgi:hypothetical protein
MSKRLAGLTLSLLLCGAAAIAFVAPTASAQAPNPNNPVLLAQAAPPNAARPGSGRALARPAPNPAAIAARRGEICQEVAARAAGRFAALEVRLDLTPAQTGAFNRWRDLRLATAKRMAGECAAAPQGAPGRGPRGGHAPPTPPTPVARSSSWRARRPGCSTAWPTSRPSARPWKRFTPASPRPSARRWRGSVVVSAWAWVVPVAACGCAVAVTAT